jgi:hypothetical protein
MTSMKKVASAAALASALLIGGCAYDDYAYGGVNVGYGNGYYYDDDPYGYGPYAYAPFGWYDGYYYPGNGYWLYDRGGGRHRWDDRHRQYWEHRRESGQWNGPATRPWRPDMRNDRQWSNRDASRDRPRAWQNRPDMNGGATPVQPRQSFGEGRMRGPDAAPSPQRGGDGNSYRGARRGN